MWPSAEVSAAQAVAPARRRSGTPPPRRRWAMAAWLLLAMASGAGLVLVARILEERGHLLTQLATLTLHREAIEGQRRELAQELAATRALLAGKDQPRGMPTPAATWTEKAPVEVLARELASKVRGGDVAVDGSVLRITLPAHALFAGAGADLSAAGGKVLDRLGGVLRRLERVQIVVGAHTDGPAPRGRYDSSWELSAARAVSAVRHLTEESGLDPGKVAAAAHAQLAPRSRVPSQNRRLEIVVTPAP
jgi:chemotaxis protein MotB